MARLGLRRGVMIGAACVLAVAGMAEAGGKGRGGGKGGHGGGGNKSSYHGGGGKGYNSCGSRNSGWKNCNSKSSSSFSFSFGTSSYGSGYSFGYGYSSGGWCAPRTYYSGSYCAPRYCAPTYCAPRSCGPGPYVYGPRYIVRDYSPTYIVVDRPPVIVTEGSTVTTYRTAATPSTTGATDFRAWQAQTELASRASEPRIDVITAENSGASESPTRQIMRELKARATADQPVEPSVHFAYTVETPQPERLPVGSVVVHTRAPLPEQAQSAIAAQPIPETAPTAEAGKPAEEPAKATVASR